MSDNEFPDNETKERWQKDPNNWIWGLFYYNKQDPRLLPPKRITALGWTINFANPRSIFLFAGLLALMFVIFGVSQAAN